MTEGGLRIRSYCPEDARKLAELFYETVHQVNAVDYTGEELEAWAPADRDMAAWEESFLGHLCLVAEWSGAIVGFGDLGEEPGYLDRLYVHKDWQGRGIATALCDQLEAAARGTVVTQASLTARPFFEKRGYRMVRRQQVERRGVLLTNFIMEKDLSKDC